MVGAVASTLWIGRVLVSLFNVDPKELGQWCSRSLSDSVGISGGANFNVAELITLLTNIPGTTDITEDFFAGNVAIAEFPEELLPLLYKS